MRTGWKHTTIDDVCQLINGGTPKTKVTEYWDGPHAWITPAEMGGRESPYISQTRRTLSLKGLAKSSATILPPYSVIVSSRAPIGHLVINEVPMATNQGCKGLVPRNGLNHKFLYYYLHSIVELLNDLGTGATFKELSATKLKSVPIPFPPLSEQKRIVAILDEAFAAIAKAVANTEKNLTNARELFESHLNSVFSQKGDGWVETTIGQQITLQRGFDITKKNQNPGNVPVVSSGGVKSFHDTPKVKAPGVVIGRKGTLGKVHYLEQDFWPHDTTLWVREFKDNMPRVVFFLLKSLDLTRLDTGTANPALNRNLVHPIKISWPSFHKQKALALELDSLSGQSQRLETIYQQKVNTLAELKQSILQKAFSGELTAGPDKILAEAGV